MKNLQVVFKESNSYSSWSEIIAGISQGSILGPLFFGISLNDLFLYPGETYLSNYTDDNTFDSIGNTIESVKKVLSNNFRITESWKLDGSKCEEIPLHVFQNW